MHRDHVAAADNRSLGVAKHRLGTYHGDSAEADDDQQQVEKADEAGGIEHAFARLFGIAHRKKAHQDVGQPRSPKHHAHAKGDSVDRVGQ